MEKGESSKNSRRARNAILTAAALTLNACGAEQNQANQKKNLTLQIVDSYESSNGFISVLREAGLKLDDSSFSTTKIKERVDGVTKFAESVKTLSVRIGKEWENMDVGVTLSSANASSLHSFIIFSDPVYIAAFTGRDTTAATAVNLENNTRVTYLAFLPDDIQTRYKFTTGKLDPNGFNLAVESCNNFINVDIDAAAEISIRSKIPANQYDGVRVVFQQLTTEAVCNSYALATAAKQGGVGYEEYQGVAEQSQLQNSTALDLRIPYIVLSKDHWETL